MDSVFLSDIELYYSTNPIIDKTITIDGEEGHHIINVMRHLVGDKIFITDGFGSIYESIIRTIAKKSLTVTIIKTNNYENQFPNICFCIPRLKSSERFEIALEKCVELGITNFIVFDSKRTVAKGDKTDRWQKILTSAMKQSLRSWLPNVKYAKSIEEIFSLDGNKILFDQNAEQTLHQCLSMKQHSPSRNHYFIFGPEGGFSEDEFGMQNVESRVKLTDNRLRSETAVISAAVILTTSAL